jgi:hypothetical protein
LSQLMRHQICESQIGRAKVRVVGGGGVLCCFVEKVAALRQKLIALRISGRSRLATCPDSRRAQKRASVGDVVNIWVKNGE